MRIAVDAMGGDFAPRATVAGAGHMMHHDRPEAVATLIREFLS